MRNDHPIDDREQKIMSLYDCMACGFTYNEADGSPANGIPSGTPWEDIDEDWLCPDCGASKADFTKA